MELRQEPVARNGLFQDLYVDFAWSETPIRNEKGETYKEGIHLNGEDAYKFLAAFNAQDKEVFNDKLRGVMGYNKVKMAISYGRYHEKEYKLRALRMSRFGITARRASIFAAVNFRK